MSSASDQQTDRPLQLGVIGVDSSHLPEFARRINALNQSGKTRCRVTRFYDPGNHQMPADEVSKWKNEAVAMGAIETETLDTLLNESDGVMVLAVSGHRHAELAKPALNRGIATYIDKPLTCNLAEAQELLAVSRQNNARCYSASSLRFAAEIASLDRASLGVIKAISAFGPGELNPAMEGLFFYGVHTIEMVDAIWGPGVKRVRATFADQRDLLELHYRDGRFAQLRMERAGSYDFGATVHGTAAVTSFKVDFSDVYNRLVQAMTHFFEGSPAPVTLRDIVENVAVMEAGNRSAKQNADWVEVPTIV